MMKKIPTILAILAILSACTGQQPDATPFPLPPTPRVGYQVVGSTKSSFMLVVDPTSITDRAGLLELSEYLCREHIKCQIWFWDDANLADTTYPIGPDKEATAIARYTWDMYTYQGDLVILKP